MTALIKFHLRRTFAVLFLIPSLEAWAQTDPLVLAQQAFTRSDFSAALKHSTDALGRQPQNLEARRLAARSSKELEKFTDCLRFMAEIPQAQITSDDVGLVGDCSSKSQVSPRVLTFLQQQLASSENREMAAYWLGRWAYQKEDYRSAEKYLNSIQVLPDRLEKERSRMMERMRELQKAQASLPAATPSPAAERPSPTTPRPRARSTEIDNRSGLFIDYSTSAQAETQLLTLSENTPVGPFTQPNYERSFLSGSLVTTAPTQTLFALSGNLRGSAGWRGTRANDGFDYTLAARGRVSGTASNAGRWLYEPPGESSFPASPLGPHGRGIDLKLTSDAGVSWNRTAEASLSGGVRWNAPSSRQARLIPLLDTNAAIRFDHLSLRLGYLYERIYGTSGGLGLPTAAWSLDLRVEKLGPFSFWAPDGFSLFRYTRATAMGSAELPRFMLMEGNYFETNLCPRFHVSPWLELAGWLRYVSSSSRQYWSGRDLHRWYGVNTADEKTAVETLLERSAMYSTNTLDTTALVVWTPPGPIELEVGMGWHKMTTRYEDFVAVDLDQRQRSGRPTPGQFRDLLDNGGESGLRYFSGIRVEF